MCAGSSCIAINVTRQKPKQRKKLKMRNAFIIAVGLVCVGALQPASAAAPKCVPVNCQVYYGTHGPTTCDQRCTQTPTAQGVKAPQTIQQQKNKRMN
jgi:hypothetical protein